LPINKRQDLLPNLSSKHCLVSKTEALNFPAEQLTSTMTTSSTSWLLLQPLHNLNINFLTIVSTAKQLQITACELPKCVPWVDSYLKNLNLFKQYDWATPVRLRKWIFRKIVNARSYHTIFLKLSINYDRYRGSWSFSSGQSMHGPCNNKRTPELNDQLAGYRTDDMCKFGRISMCHIWDISSNTRK